MEYKGRERSVVNFCPEKDAHVIAIKRFWEILEIRKT